MITIATVNDIITRIKNDYFIAESTDNVVILSYLNSVQRKLYEITNKGKHTILLSIANQYAYSLPEDCTEVHNVWFDNNPIELVSVDWLNGHRPNWRTETGVPKYYAVDKGLGKLYLNPAPDSDNASLDITVEHEYRPEALASDSVLTTPPELDDIYVHYAIWQIAEQYRDFTTATRRASMYSSRVQEVISEAFNDQAGYPAGVDEYNHLNWRFVRG